MRCPECCSRSNAWLRFEGSRVASCERARNNGSGMPVQRRLRLPKVHFHRSLSVTAITLTILTFWCEQSKDQASLALSVRPETALRIPLAPQDVSIGTGSRLLSRGGRRQRFPGSTPQARPQRPLGEPEGSHGAKDRLVQFNARRRHHLGPVLELTRQFRRKRARAVQHEI